MNAPVDPSTLKPEQPVVLRSSGLEAPSVFCHQIGLLFFFGPPDGGAGLVVVAHDDGTLRDCTGQVVEVLHAE